jgi:SulP family sulfate permease
VTTDSYSTEHVGFRGLIREISAGLIGSLLSLAYCFSFAALIFAGPLAPHLAEGVAAALITGAISAILIALLSGFQLAIAGPASHTVAPLAVMIVALLPTLTARPPDEVLMISLAALMATTLLTGAALFALGWGRLGMLVRFVPYPVMTGFLAATGWLLASGAMRVTNGAPLTLSSMLSFAVLDTDLILGMTALWADAHQALSGATRCDGWRDPGNPPRTHSTRRIGGKSACVRPHVRCQRRRTARGAPVEWRFSTR